MLLSDPLSLSLARFNARFEWLVPASWFGGRGRWELSETSLEALSPELAAVAHLGGT